VCLNLEKLEKKKQICKVILFLVWFAKSQKEKNQAKKYEENLYSYEEKFFLQNMREK